METSLTNWQHEIVDEYQCAIAIQADTVVSREKITDLIFLCGLERVDDIIHKMNEHDAKALELSEFKTAVEPSVDPEKRNIKPTIVEECERPHNEIDCRQFID